MNELASRSRRFDFILWGFTIAALILAGIPQILFVMLGGAYTLLLAAVLAACALPLVAWIRRLLQGAGGRGTKAGVAVAGVAAMSGILMAGLMVIEVINQ